ncbi:MAG TPA: response regulator [Prolixibacteraceae bacterium]|jgi:CheY-like chemotaxis protein|nr:response regulator [Prolixibacteraceae bacterium]
MENDVLYILLADDDADDRLFFKEAMEEINADTFVSFVNDGSQLMYFLNQPGIRLPNIIFLDLNMPVKNGMDCLKEIRANDRFKDMMIAIYSTSGSENDIQEAFAFGADVYIKKPNNFTDLKASLAKVINRSAQTIL